MILRHARMMLEFKGEYIGIREIRKHAAWYTAGYPHGARSRCGNQSGGKLRTAGDTIDGVFRLMHRKLCRCSRNCCSGAGWTRCGAGGNFTDERQSGLKENILTECGQFAIIPRLLWIIYALFQKAAYKKYRIRGKSNG